MKSRAQLRLREQLKPGGAWRPLDELPDWLVVRVLRRFQSIGGRDRALGLAGQAFLAFIPIAIIWAAFGSHDSTAANSFIERFHLRGAAADAAHSLFARPPEAGGALTLIGLLVLMGSLLTFSRLLQGTFEAAWDLPHLGVRGTVLGLAGVAVLFCEVMLLSLLATALRDEPRPLVLALRALVSVPILLGLQIAMLSGRVTWRRALPGAVVLAVGQILLSFGSAIFMPRLVEHNAQRYGVIGVTFALLSWLIVLGILLVAGAAISAELGRERGDGRREPRRSRSLRTR